MEIQESEIIHFIKAIAEKSFFNVDRCNWDSVDFNRCVEEVQQDYYRYYAEPLTLNKIIYFRGLLATFFYRFSRCLFLNNQEESALELSSLSSYITGIELYYSANIGSGLKINHGVGTVVGARSIVGNNVLLHQNVTLGEKNGRPTIEDNVVIYPGAVVVGPITVGENSIIGANSFLDKSIPSNSRHK